MVDLDLCYTPATELARRIRAKQLSPVELVKNSLARIEQVNPKLNCFCFVYPEEAIELAKKAEVAVMRGDKLGPLHGLPVAIKDLTPTKGKRTTLGSYCYEHWVPDWNATIVDKLVARASTTKHLELAQVRTAVPLTADQEQRLAAALTNATGKQLNLKVVVDPSILGGLVAGRSQAEIAEGEGISPSAVSQRVRGDGLAVVTAAQELLEGVSR